jgi:homoserine O-acetyltransferase
MEDVYVGEDHALDPSKYFIIVVDQLGSGVSTSPQNNPAPQTMGKFPDLSIGDDVAAQHKLISEHFGIEKLALVVGGSMGGQQVYEWAVVHPEMVERAAPIAATARISLHQKVFVQTLEEAIKSDPCLDGRLVCIKPRCPERHGPDGQDRRRAWLVARVLSGRALEQCAGHVFT